MFSTPESQLNVAPEIQSSCHIIIPPLASNRESEGALEHEGQGQTSAAKSELSNLMENINHSRNACACIFTSPAVRLVTGSGNLGGQLHLVARLVTGGPVSAQSDHAAGETGQVTHLMLQQPSLPLRYVRQPAARLPHQVGFYCLRERERLMS